MESCITNVLCNKFKVLPVKFNESSTVTHYLYGKPHQVRELNSNKPVGRTLFLINIPPYCTEKCLKRLFSDCGEVEEVIFEPLHGSEFSNYSSDRIFNTKPIQGYKVGYVVFKEDNHCEAVMKINDKTPRILSTENYPLTVGINKWCNEYNNSKPDISKIKSEINDHMKKFDEKYKLKIMEEKKMDGVPDEEGWITVTRHGKRPVALRTEAVERKVLQKEKKKRAQKELRNFYSFQIRESKMDHIIELRKKFEEDKQRISLLKAARKFKPY